MSDGLDTGKKLNPAEVVVGVEKLDDDLKKDRDSPILDDNKEIEMGPIEGKE